MIGSTASEKRQLIKQFNFLRTSTESATGSDYIEDKIESLMTQTRELYWYIRNDDKKWEDEFDYNFLGVLETANEYLTLTYDEINKSKLKTNTYIPHHSSILYKIQGGDELALKRMSLFMPILTIPDINKSWGSFIDINSFKVGFTIVGTILTFLFGVYGMLDKVLIGMVVFHTLMRFVANRHKGNDSYIDVNKNIQLFLWPFILLAVGNLISYIVVLNGLPPETLPAALELWLIYGEYVGFIENAEKAKLPIPTLFKKLAKKNSILPF